MNFRIFNEFLIAFEFNVEPGDIKYSEADVDE
jgi:hypothetical protein